MMRSRVLQHSCGWWTRRRLREYSAAAPFSVRRSRSIARLCQCIAVRADHTRTKKEDGVGCSVYVKKVVKWQVDMDGLLFSYDPHELASWVKKIVELTR